MRQLAIECSGLHGSVAVLNNAELVAIIRLPGDRSSVQSLAKAVKTIVNQTGGPVDFISVTNGPGSFTGLRVGVTTCKMLAMAWCIPVVAVDTLEVLAVQTLRRHTPPPGTLLCPIINAFRRQLFTGVWAAAGPEQLLRLSASYVVDADLWQTSILPPELDSAAVPGAASIIVSGPGLSVCQPAIDRTPQGYSVQSVSDVESLAEVVGLLGLRDFRLGLTHSAESLVANYVRASAAEEKLNK